MASHPLLTLRSSDGFTSVNHCSTHLLTTSSAGNLSKWDRASGNNISSWKIKGDLVSAIPLRSPGSESYTSVALQHKGGVCLFDICKSAVTYEILASACNFARIRLLQDDQSLLLCPSGLSDIVCQDIRQAPCDPAIKEIKSGTTEPHRDAIVLCLDDDDLGSLQNFEPLPSLGPSYVLATYECGRISVFDIRNSKKPVLSSDACRGVEGLPSLAAWKSVILVGDTNGEIFLFGVSQASGLSMLLRTKLSGDDHNPCVAGCLRIRQDGAITVACCWDNSVRILETRNLQVRAVYREHLDSITDINFDPSGGEFATSGLDGNAHVWSI